MYDLHRFQNFQHIAELHERIEQRHLRRPRVFRDRENPLDVLSDDAFFKRFRMPRAKFYELLQYVHDDLEHNTQRNHALLPSQQLMIGLRFFACGSFQQVIGDTINVHKSTVSRTIQRVITAILKLRKEYIYWPSEPECAAIALELHELHHFPCVEGFIDGTHIKIVKPKHHEVVFVNRKDFHSINVQICGNGRLMITDVVAKWPGSVHDSRILKTSSLYDKFKQQQLPRLPNGVILGDSGYPLLTWLLVPIVEYPAMTASEKLYNKTHRSTRSMIERIIGILKRRWACLKELRMKPAKCCEITVACCILHNYCRDLPINDEEGQLDDIGLDDCSNNGQETEETEEGKQQRAEFIRSFFS